MKYQEVTLKVSGPVPSSDETQRQTTTFVPGQDTVLRGWYIYKDTSETTIKNFQRRLMVFFHENAGNIGLRLDYFELAYKRLNCDIFVMAYRGYSDSDGKPDEALIKKDMEYVNSYITSQFKHKYYHAGGIYLVGRSLGGAVAAYLAHVNEQASKQNYYEHNFNGLVLENTFTSIDAMVDHLFPVLSYVKPFVLNMHWDTHALMDDLRTPVLLVVGEKDELVPPDQGLKLYDQAKNSIYRDFLSIQEGSHNDSWQVGGIEYVEKLNGFFTKCAELRSYITKLTQNLENEAKQPKVNPEL